MYTAQSPHRPKDKVVLQLPRLDSARDNKLVFGGIGKLQLQFVAERNGEEGSL